MASKGGICCCRKKPKLVPQQKGCKITRIIQMKPTRTWLMLIFFLLNKYLILFKQYIFQFKPCSLAKVLNIHIFNHTLSVLMPDHLKQVNSLCVHSILGKKGERHNRFIISGIISLIGNNRKIITGYWYQRFVLKELYVAFRNLCY